MDTKTLNNVVTDVADKPSRLPAGSTLEIQPGLHVPHPHAEVNLAGAGDPRMGDTKAVTEYVKSTKVPGHNGDGTLIETTLETKPLSEDVLPRRLTIATDAKKLPEVIAVEGTGTAAPNPDLAIKQDPEDKTFEATKN